jgi:DNA-binding NtrC family response regulator
MVNPGIIIVEDDLRMSQLIKDILKEEGIVDPIVTSDSREAVRLAESQHISVVITDLRMRHVDGIGVLEHAKKANPDAVVILITGYGTVESAIEAMKKGAYDYIQKPFEPDEFLLVLRRAIERVRLLDENKRLMQQIESCRQDELVGTSKAVNDLKELVSKVAPFDATVLVQGETGTGKELVARLIHENSKRRSAKFLPINCGALHETLLESEIFGHEKGAFTGADRRKPGLFESADKGTVFLDEISATSENFQVKLLRVLQEGSLLRVGGTEPVAIDVRVVAASNIPLEEEAKAGRFRKDLFYRLNVLAIEIPPLRKRKEDIPLLAYHFLNKYSGRYGKAFGGIDAGVVGRLLEYSWPGNVRELENVMERAVIMESAGEITSVHLPRSSGAELNYEDMCSGLASIKDMEKALISRTLQSLNGQKTKAAEVLGVSTTTLWRKMKEYDLE